MDSQISNPLSHQCPECGSARLGVKSVKTSIWRGDRLLVVEGIPAVVCESCGERFFDDATAATLDLMQGNGFSEDAAVAHLSVPVFLFPQFHQTNPSRSAESEV